MNAAELTTRYEIRLRILELALEHGISTDKIAVAEDFAEFVFDHEPRRARFDATRLAKLKTSKRR